MTKKRRSLFIVFGVICVCVLSSAFVLTGCGNKHKFKGDWVSDESGHWKECTKHDDCGEIDGPYEHEWDDGVVTVEPTCAEGKMTYTCTECGYTTTKVLSATDEHTFTISDETKDIVWTWASDGKSATATVVCGVCKESVDFTASVDSGVLDDNGDTVYTAKVTINGKDYTSTKTVEAGTVTPEPGTETHTHVIDGTTGVSWVWADDYSTATATFTCTAEGCDWTGGTYSETYTLTGSDIVAVQTDCEVAGSTTYTATITIGGTEYTDTKTVDGIPAAGAHTWGTGTVTKTATCTEKGETTYTCSVCGATKTEEISALGHALTKIDEIPATCTETGTEAYWTCSVCNKLFSDGAGTAEIEEPKTIPATGHTYSETESKTIWTWDIENSTASVEVECTVCHEYSDSIVTAPTYDSTTLKWTATATFTYGTGTFTFTSNLLPRVSGLDSVTDSTGLTLRTATLEAQDLHVTETTGEDGNIVYVLEGVASFMDEDIATAYDNPNFGAGDAYVVIKIYVENGYTISYTKLNGEEISYTNDRNSTTDFSGSWFYLVTRIAGTDGQIAVEDQTFTITSTTGEGENAVTTTVDTFTISFANIITHRVTKTTSEDSEGLVIGETSVSSQDLTITVEIGENGSVTYVLEGQASFMTEEIAKAYDNPNFAEGDAYVVVKIYVEEGYTISYTGLDNKQKSFTNDGTDDNFIGNWFFLVTRVGGTDGAIAVSDQTFTITKTVVTTDETPGDTSSTTENVATFTISFQNIVTYRVVPGESTDSDGLKIGDVQIKAQDMTVTGVDTENGIVYVLEGEASFMTDEIAKAYDNPDFVAGDAYVVVKIYVEEGYTISYMGLDGTYKSYTNNQEQQAKGNFIDNWFFLVVRVGGNDGVVAVSDQKFTITYTVTDEDGTETVVTVSEFTISFENIITYRVLPADKSDSEGLKIGDVVIDAQDMTVTATYGGDGEVVYVLEGQASFMTEEIAEAYDNPDFSEGDAYVVVKIYVEEGATISYTGLNGDPKSFTNDGEDANFVGNWFFLVTRVGGKDGKIAVEDQKFTITTADGTVKEFTISFAKIVTYRVLPADKDADSSDLYIGSTPIEAQDMTVTAVDTADGVVYVLEGQASFMDENVWTAYDNKDFSIGDAYVVIKIYVEEGYTISWESLAVDEEGNPVVKSYTNDSTDSNFTDNWFFLVTRVGGNDGKITVADKVYTISMTVVDEDGNETLVPVYSFTISFKNIVTYNVLPATEDDDLTYGTTGKNLEAQNMTVTTTDGETYVLDGVVSVMNQDIANWYGDEASEGDGYVVIKIYVEEGYTISYDTDKHFTNNGDDTNSFEGNWFFVVVRVCSSDGKIGENLTKEYTISHEGATVRTIIVDFSGLEYPEDDENPEAEVNIVITDNASESMSVGAEITLTITVDGNSVDSYTVTATTDTDNTVITVAENKITIVAAGTTTVSVSFTYDGVEYTETYTITVPVLSSEKTDELPSVTVDFSDSGTYGWMSNIGTQNGGVGYTDSTGLLTAMPSGTSSSSQNADTAMTINTNGYLSVAGKTQNSGRYFEIDLTSYEGYYVTISVKFATASNGDERSIIISDSYTTNSVSGSVYAFASNSNNNGTNPTTYTYTRLIGNSEKLYLTWDANIRIYSISVAVSSDATPTAVPTAVEITASSSETYVVGTSTGDITITASTTVESGSYTGGYTWSVKHNASGTVLYDISNTGTLTITPVDAGTITISVMLWDGPSVTCQAITITVTNEFTVSVTDASNNPVTTVAAGGTATISVANGSSADITSQCTFTSSDSTTLSIDASSGTMTAGSPASDTSVTITVSYNGVVIGVVTITVSKATT